MADEGHDTERQSVEHLPSQRKTSITDELNKIVAMLKAACPEHAIISLEFDGRLHGKVTCVFLPDYGMGVAKTLVAGCDIWLNTPLPPLEASGTSGMKAALNGVLNFSVLDGWWVEACIEGVTGWAIGEDGGASSSARHGAALCDKLENVVLPLFYDRPDEWRQMMRQSIAYIASYFNSQRMMRRYAAEAYLR